MAANAIDQVKTHYPEISNYKAIHYLINHEQFLLDDGMQDTIEQIEIDNKFNPTKTQAEEIMQRYGRIKHIMQQTMVEADPLQKAMFNERLDDILMHRVWGYVILMSVLFLLFQSIFWVAKYPMDGIEWVFGRFSGLLSNVLPVSWWSD